MPDARGVVVSISLTKLDHIDTVTRSCYIDFGIQMWWKEDKVRGKDDGEYEVSEFDFKPDVVVHNSVDLDPKMKNNNDNVRCKKSRPTQPSPRVTAPANSASFPHPL